MGAMDEGAVLEMAMAVNKIVNKYHGKHDAKLETDYLAQVMLMVFDCGCRFQSPDERAESYKTLVKNIGSSRNSGGEIIAYKPCWMSVSEV
ncbi:MAG: hypothetical protein ACYCTW_09890 [Sulfuricella sp.]